MVEFCFAIIVFKLLPSMVFSSAFLTSELVFFDLVFIPVNFYELLDFLDFSESFWIPANYRLLAGCAVLFLQWSETDKYCFLPFILWN